MCVSASPIFLFSRKEMEFVSTVFTWWSLKQISVAKKNQTQKKPQKTRVEKKKIGMSSEGRNDAYNEYNVKKIIYFKKWKTKI